VIWMERNGGTEYLDDFRGLSSWAPLPAATMLVLMLSLAGIPPTIGFLGKYYVFLAAVNANLTWLAVIGVLNSAISLYYYIRLVVFMYLKKETTGSEPVAGPSMTMALTVAVVATLVLGVYPRLLFQVAEASARTLGATGILAALR
jgi:NADH-quinone oxidoreductase subunit N